MLGKCCRRVLRVLLVVLVVDLAFELATDAVAQDVVYYANSAWYPTTVYYVPAYTARTLYWSPTLGFHTHSRYVEVPYEAPATYWASSTLYVWH